MFKDSQCVVDSFMLNFKDVHYARQLSFFTALQEIYMYITINNKYLIDYSILSLLELT